MSRSSRPPSTATSPTPALPQNATADQLAVMRKVAVDDALWYLHNLMFARNGAGSAIEGRIRPGPSFVGDEASLGMTFVQLAASNGHPPAYPAGTYDHAI